MKTLVVLIGLLAGQVAQANWYIRQQYECLMTVFVVKQSPAEVARGAGCQLAAVSKDKRMMTMYCIDSTHGFRQEKLYFLFTRKNECEQF